MSTYPGEDPQQPSDRPEQPADETAEQPQADEASGDAGTEPTQPVGYWERQAAEQARMQTQQGDPSSAAQGEAVLNPTTAPYEQNPYAPSYAPPSYAQPQQPPPYAQPYYGPPPPYAYPPPGGQSAPPPGAHPGYPPYAFSPPRPDHPQANLAMILGICGLAFGFIACGIGFLASPFAWALGRNALKEIQASQGRLGGESSARTGMVLGIIGTVLLFLAVAGIVIFGLLVAFTDTSSGSNI